MSAESWTDGTLTLSGKEMPIRTGFLRVGELKFYPQNPRLYSIVCAGEEEPSQAVIQKRLAAMDHVKQLVQSIRANGGLTDPLIVRDGDYVVLEGNSRLAAYRLLEGNDPIKWGKVKCTLLPKNISESMVFALLGEYHIIGKKDWAPYEQAGYLYRRYKQHGVEPARMAEEMGLSTKMVGHLIDIYSFMIKHGDDVVERWSYHDEFLSHHSIAKAREECPELDGVFVEKVKSGEIPKAVDVRDKLTKIAAVGGKVLKTFVTGEGNFESCYDRAVARGADNVWYKRLNKFHEQLSDPDLKDIFLDMNEAHRKKCVFEMKKIKHILDGLLSKLS
ncbi:MAG: ParB N-terminal domain-containing protein [Dehalococcoidales bacterium]|nr:ParB N-terminal domain-containing protein [Dehalococcoidales bacterium]